MEEPIKVIILSSTNLTQHQIHLLSRGLKYTPAPKRSMEELRDNIKKFTEKITLEEYFYNYSENKNYYRHKSGEKQRRLQSAWEQRHSSGHIQRLYGKISDRRTKNEHQETKH